MNPALSMRRVAKRYRAGVRGCSITVSALRAVDLDVAEGECVGLLGPRGAGKSTLLLCAAGLLRPDAGTVAWFGLGRLTRTAPPGVVYVGERAAHYGFLTVREAVEFHATLYESGGRDLAWEVGAALACSALEEREAVRVSALAGLDLRRLALAQAIVRQPRLLLLDETLSDLDAAERAALAELLGGLRGAHLRGLTVVVSASEPGALAGLADRVVAIERGVVCDPACPDAAVVPRQLAPGAGVGARATRVAERGAGASVDPGAGAS